MKFKKIPQYIKNIISGETKIRLDIQHKSKELAESIFEMSPSSKGKENSSPYSKLVAIDGIAGFAGSSAITDFLAEFSECTVYGGVDMRENPDRGEENNYEEVSKEITKFIGLPVTKQIKKNAFFNVLKTLMGIIFPLITFPYTSRILLPDGLGKVNFANSIISSSNP